MTIQDARPDPSAHPGAGSEASLGGAWLDAVLRRRGVVGAGGVLLGATALGSSAWGRQVMAAVADPLGAEARDLERISGLRAERLRRESDQLSLDLLIGAMTTVVQDGVVRLRAQGPEPGYLAFVLPAQALGEAWTHGAQALSASAPAVKAELARPALLAFSVPVGGEIGYDIASLLDWSGLTPIWSGTGRSRIEAPYRFSVAPVGTTRWRHDTAPRLLTDADGQQTEVTEVWHSRLGAASDQHRAARLRVVDVYDTSLKIPVDAADRAAIAKVAGAEKSTSKAGPVGADLFVLSPLGASIELHGRWPDAPGSLVAWDHRTTLGRDQYVRTVNRGFLMPWGHPAVIVEETRRKMRLRGAGDAARPAAVLEKTITVVVTDPVVDTSVVAARTSGGVVGGSQLPFTSVRCLTRISPALRDRELSSIKSGGGLPRLAEDGSFLRMPFVGVDWEGRETPFTSVVGFLPAGLEHHPGVVSVWNGASADLRAVDHGGRAVALVPPPSGSPGSTRVGVGTARVGVVFVPPKVSMPIGRAPFRPIWAELGAVVPAVSALGSTGGSTAGGARADRAGAERAGAAPVLHSWPAAYLADQANKGGVYLEPTKPVSAPSAADLTGGLGSLPQAYQGLSTKVGAVLASSAAALDQLATKGAVVAGAVFDGLTLFGHLSLVDLVVDGLDAVPKAVTEVVGQRQTVTTRLAPTLQPKLVGPLRFDPGTLTVVTTLAAGGQKPPEHTLDARLVDSTLQLASLVKLPIEDLHITSTTAAPFDITLILGKVEFLGALAFVQELAAVLEPFVSGARPAAPATSTFRSAASPTASRVAARLPRGGPDVDADTSGLHLSQAIALPDVQVGVFRLSGLNFGLGVDLLFVGGLGARFTFASHENPFQVVYGPFGGGGYCALELDGGDVTDLEVSLMVCGGVGIDLGVASGAISVAAGLVLSLPADGPLSLTGFFRASGALEVLGLVSVSVVFEITLGYADTDPVTLTGSADLALKVEVCWVSKTVHASVQKTFSGGAKAAPLGSRAAADAAFSFADVYPDASPWQTYADSFSAGA